MKPTLISRVREVAQEAAKSKLVLHSDPSGAFVVHALAGELVIFLHEDGTYRVRQAEDWSHHDFQAERL